ncbi:hypothetical protein A4A49_36724 [Nicotiana attenuata]|uniref:Uncharacterized protein n=1 Tax=Nicotiana attenuata TaxID=49451 RepID=A0A314KQ24_NICAT|nr:hypothetical protein A4A49_36724 [Nicotiana attenuata]
MKNEESRIHRANQQRSFKFQKDTKIGRYGSTPSLPISFWTFGSFFFTSTFLIKFTVPYFFSEKYRHWEMEFV